MHQIVVDGIWFAAAHRVEGHPKCGRLHGHNYRVKLCIEGTVNERTGFVVDFGEIKSLVKGHIDEFIDHRYLVGQRNIEENDVYYKAARQDLMVMDDVVELPIPQTTAEYLAQFFFETFVHIIAARWRVDLAYVEVQETPTSTARYTNRKA